MAGRGNFQVRRWAPIDQMGQGSTRDADMRQAITYACYDLEAITLYAPLFD